jgi:hypothetical protein
MMGQGVSPFVARPPIAQYKVPISCSIAACEPLKTVWKQAPQATSMAIPTNLDLYAVSFLAVDAYASPDFAAGLLALQKRIN